MFRSYPSFCLVLSVVLSVAAIARPTPAVEMTSDLVLLDLEKFQELPFRIYYPHEPGRYPAIIYSHRRGGDQSSCEAMSRHWAQEGFICIVPSHQDPLPERLKDPRFYADIPNSTATQAILKRIEDIRFILDSLEDIASSTLPDGVRIDTARIGLVGADWGAQVAQLMGGAALVHAFSNETVSFREERIDAFLLLEPPPDSKPFKRTQGSWSNFNRPLMVVAGVNCSPRTVEELQGFLTASPGGNKSFLHIQAEKGSPAKTNLTGPASPQSPFPVLSFQPESRPSPANPAFDVLSRNTLCFWKAFLEGDRFQFQRLQTGNIEIQGLPVSYHFHK